jgi:membrane protein YdbS with pleckstrin-like domain
MLCQQCGADVVEGSVYCHKCGARVGSPDEDWGPPTGNEAAAGGNDQTPIERFSQSVANHRQGGDAEEREIWTGRYSSKDMLGNWIVSGLVTIALIVGAVYWGEPLGWQIIVVVILLLWLYQLLLLAYRVISVRYRLTSQRFFHEAGILRRVTDRIEVIDIDDVTYEQSIVQRLVGVGTIRIVSSDRSHPELAIPGIENVAEVASKIDEARHRERRARGLHIESV